MGPFSPYPIAIYLCHKPVIGLMMFALFLCAAPYPFEDEPVDLTTAGSTIRKSITIPAEMTYVLEVAFEFPSDEARLKDQIVGSNHARSCLSFVSDFDIPGVDRIRYEDIPDIERRQLGSLIPFHVVIRKKADQSVVVDRTFESLCTTGLGEKTKYREIAWMKLPRDYYALEVTNLHGQPGLTGVKTTMNLHGSLRK
jgi:hypothetical protein